MGLVPIVPHALNAIPDKPAVAVFPGRQVEKVVVRVGHSMARPKPTMQIASGE
jgi:hypothetical protein